MYGVNTTSSSDAISRDMKSLLYSSTFKHPADSEFAKIKQLISLDPFPHELQNNQNLQDRNHVQLYENQQGSLQRYRSTPSSFFSNLLNDNGDNECSDPVTASSDNEHEQRFIPKSNAPRDFLHSTMKQETKEVMMNQNDNRNSYGYVNQSNLDSRDSNLMRQTSSPAGYLSSLTLENGK